ncbi:hypothetical protein DL766_002087 [Monosporascus sp. MC13-8B]|uniref:ferric-chelate reductase (NADPH) n=1 Tax=Monosporascus cannonballus TaxID=155416 RepID=A0ABY0H005_9PEZI|nr:hypothetical protein DL762_008255 [Monosporascus cannonballus]RYO81684.1 hypothetical protein DL763_008498 [Monosporascus cannonballus]RYP36200.1 hypothetical protein DL766_002087 [Monosporascus sp. MC13-8B]
MFERLVSGTAGRPLLSIRSATGRGWGEHGPKAQWLLDRQKIHEAAIKRYAASLSALIAVFIVAYWIRFAAARLRLTKRTRTLMPFALVSRVARRSFIRGLPGFTSAGHAMLVVVYVALNVTFTVYGIEDYSRPTTWSSRLGWMATGNMVLVVFLALKNTPLALLTPYSYEQLNGLHQITGYTTVIQSIAHGVIYVVYFANAGRWETLHEDIVIVACVLLVALFFSAMAGLILKRLNYESFYIVHVLCFIVIVITLGLHRPKIDPDKVLIATLLIAALWVSDRLIRFGRLVYSAVNNSATVYPLPNGGTRIVFKKPLTRARPGKHCYVWLPQIRAFETHPFTIVSDDPLELVINTYSGFTRDLHKFAVSNPGATLQASLEGPYGTIPDPMGYDKVVLVAGGAGATFTFGLAADMLRRMNETSTQRIEFIWAVRRHDNLSWFTQHLNNIRTHVHASRVALKVHLTSMPAPSSTDRASNLQPGDGSGNAGYSLPTSPTSPFEKETGYPLSPSIPSPVTLCEDPEKDVNISDSDKSLASSSSTELPLIHGRPDTEGLIRAAVQSAAKDQRVLVAVCGPNGLIEKVRNTAASCIRVGGPAVELHCEQFSW